MMRGPTPALIAVALLPIWGCGTPGSEPREAGSLTVLKGTATRERDGRKTPLVARTSVPVHVGDRVQTAADSEAVITSGKQVHVLGPTTELAVDAASDAAGDGISQVRLFSGLATFLLPAGEKKTYKFQALSHTVLAAAKGTVFRVERQGGDVSVSVLQGEVDVFRLPSDAAGGPGVLERATRLRELGQGQRLLTGGADVKVDTMSSDEIGRLKQSLFFTKESLNLDLSHF